MAISSILNMGSTLPYTLQPLGKLQVALQVPLARERVWEMEDLEQPGKEIFLIRGKDLLQAQRYIQLEQEEMVH